MGSVAYALLGVVTDERGKLFGLQRTWLARDGGGKAPLPEPRRALGNLLGHGVRFGTAGDIMAAGDDNQVFEFMNVGSGFQAETCVVAPSILIDELEMYPSEEESPKPPIVPAPPLTQ